MAAARSTYKRVKPRAEVDAKWVIFGAHEWEDPMGIFMVDITNMIVERTRAGLDAVKAQGRTGGRPTVITEDLLTVAKARKAKGESVRAVAKALGVSRATLYRHIG
ncbi:helix-turn-helix domain-containing protein [Streptomyces antimycoticus]|uniref:helix-turn-helix domain-containing protein n=1 Tax=Streptomyces antimycoticus TaxID=68175 RepID=UPI002570FF71|nr:helix-turn-helix domain-containing protein [Streptomyces antimycoticus]WJD98855.1 helix-turn-helix domain-containing protein [Streptomyces antimycoticus]